MWGLRLGIRVASIRATGRYMKGHPTRVHALQELGFEWQVVEEAAPPAVDATAADDTGAAEDGTLSFFVFFFPTHHHYRYHPHCS